MASPAVAAAPSPRDGRQTVWRYFWLAVVLCTPVILALEATVGWLLPALFGSAFDDAIPMARILLIGALFLSLRRVLTDGARGLGRPGIGTVAEVASWVVLLPAVAVAAAFGDATDMAVAVSVAAFVGLAVIIAGLVVRPGVAEDGAARWFAARRTHTGRMTAALGSRPVVALIVAMLAVDVLVASVFALPGPAPWIATGGLAVVLGIIVLRAEYQRQRRAWLARTEVDPAPPERVAGAAAARIFYYAGTAAIGILLLRFGGATASDLLYLVSLGLVAAGMIVTGANRPVLLPSALLVGVLLFCVGGLFTAFYTASAPANLAVLIRVAYLVAVWFWLGTMVLTTPAHVRTAMLWWVVSAALASVGAIVQTVFGDVIPGGTVHFGRVSGLTDHVNDLGGLAGLVAVPALALLYKRMGATTVQRLVAALCLPLIGTGLMLSGSISGAMAAVVSGFVWVVATRTFIRGVAAFALLLAVSSAIAASGISPYFESPFDRVRSSTANTGTDDATFWSRIDSYEAAWVDIRQHPLHGLGLRPEDTPTATGAQVHNNLMKPLFEGGVFAAVGMALIYLVIGVAGWQTVVRARSPDEHLVALAALCSYIAYFTWGLSQPALFKRFGWISGALVLALWAQQLRAVRVLEQAQPEAPAASRSRRRLPPAPRVAKSP